MGQGGGGREGGLGAERGPVGGSCECLVRGEGSQESKGGDCWDRVVEAGRVVSGPRGGQLVGVVSAWCEVRAAERAKAGFVGRGWWRQGGWSRVREGASSWELLVLGGR